MTRRSLPHILVNVFTVGILLGILFMIQPWTFVLFKPGFLILLVSTIGFIIVTHIPERANVIAPNQEAPEEGPVRSTGVE